ncbi:MAG: metallophosphoesterase family protein [Pelagimonas sp.]|uniref:metallophosphoesterase family protein n=1 Tax=Pelagimonas sp. TaxID=2073170 RepID=UPI003D6A5903
MDMFCIEHLFVHDGPVLIFGGPYSNLQATQAMRSEAERLGIPPQRCICTGDVVAYCGHPAETVAEIRDWGCAVVAGNCEKQLAAQALDCGCGFEEGTACDRLSAAWFTFAGSRLDQDARDWMASLPDAVSFGPDNRERSSLCIHGGFTDVSRFLWSTSPQADFDEELNALIGLDQGTSCGTRFVFSGHSGIPFERQIGDVRWVNAGVIGMPPNDGGRATRYAVFDAGTITFHRLSYDAQAARAQMERVGLIQGYHQGLTSGFWPSEDVLPLELRKQRAGSEV